MDIIIDTHGDYAQNVIKEPEISSNIPDERKLKLKQLLEELEDDEPKPYEIDTKPSNTFNNSRNLLKEQILTNITSKTKKRLDVSSKIQRSDEVNKLLAKSDVLKPEFETKHSIGSYNTSEKKLKEERRKERAKTKGNKWFGLPATEMTDEIKRDLEVLQMRSVLDPKRFYKKNDNKILPKYFQLGKVLDSPLDYYNNRMTKKERKKTLVDELMADAEFTRYNKAKYAEIIKEKQKTHYKAWREAKKLKRKKRK